MLPRRLPQLAARVARTQQAQSATRRNFSSALVRPAAAAASKNVDHGPIHDSHTPHESEYNTPGGWLWGIKPGEKYEREGWEIPIYLMIAAYVIAGVAYCLKEDTS